MKILKDAHDSLGHRGFYATKSLIEVWFWWPEMEGDVSWYVKTCHACQLRQKSLPRAPPPVTYTPSIFQECHIDTMHMTPALNGCNKILHGRCALLAWP